MYAKSYPFLDLEDLVMGWSSKDLLQIAIPFLFFIRRNPYLLLCRLVSTYTTIELLEYPASYENTST